MALEDHTPIRRFRLPDGEWEQYARVVGERQRSADIAAYIRWRIANPEAPLPSKRRRSARSVLTSPPARQRPGLRRDRPGPVDSDQ